MNRVRQDQFAADIVVKALDHWGVDAWSSTSGTGQVSVKFQGIHQDGQRLRVWLAVEAEAEPAAE